MRNIRRALCALGTATAIGATLLWAAGEAAAADGTPCNGPTGRFCVAININNPAVKSARLEDNGPCLLGPFEDYPAYTHFPAVNIDLEKETHLHLYTQDTKCGGPKVATRTVIGGSWSEDSDNSHFLDGRWAVFR